MAEDNWVFDSLGTDIRRYWYRSIISTISVGFLRGPVWNVPILTFIEHKSLSNKIISYFLGQFTSRDYNLVFEPDEDDRNEKEYKIIHDDYKNLVDFMLGSYMEDIGITPKQFEEACGKGSKRSFQHGLFEQVLSYQRSKECFKRYFSIGLGCWWLWDLQTNDDPEKHRASVAGAGAPSAEVWSPSRVSPANKEKRWQWWSGSGGNQKVHSQRNTCCVIKMRDQVKFIWFRNQDIPIIQASSDH